MTRDPRTGEPSGPEDPAFSKAEVGAVFHRARLNKRNAVEAVSAYGTRVLSQVTGDVKAARRRGGKTTGKQTHERSLEMDSTVYKWANEYYGAKMPWLDARNKMIDRLHEDPDNPKTVQAAEKAVYRATKLFRKIHNWRAVT